MKASLCDVVRTLLVFDICGSVRHHLINKTTNVMQLVFLFTCCMNISATMLQMGEPTETPFSGW
jgi:hypothetical protein